MAKRKPSAIPTFDATILSMLSAIAAATVDPARQMLYIPLDMAKPLIEALFIEVNEAMKTPEGAVPAKTTAAGVDYLAKLSAPPAPPVPDKVRPVFVIEKGIPLPAIKRGGGKMETIYPFATMDAGDSFFIPATAEKPEPWKSLASTVASANQRFAVKKVDEAGQPVMRTTRKGKSVQAVTATKTFAVRNVEVNGVKGARIWREK